MNWKWFSIGGSWSSYWFIQFPLLNCRICLDTSLVHNTQWTDFYVFFRNCRHESVFLLTFVYISDLIWFSLLSVLFHLCFRWFSCILHLMNSAPIWLLKSKIFYTWTQTHTDMFAVSTFSLFCHWPIPSREALLPSTSSGSHYLTPNLLRIHSSPHGTPTLFHAILFALCCFKCLIY